MAYELTASVHKGTCSSSSIAHNRRTIAVPHACKEREPLNIHYVDMDLEEAYHFFDKALEDIHGVSKNINQIAKRINSTDNIYAEDMRQLKQKQEDIWQLLKSILSQLP